LIGVEDSEERDGWTDWLVPIFLANDGIYYIDNQFSGAYNKDLWVREKIGWRHVFSYIVGTLYTLSYIEFDPKTETAKLGFTNV